MSEQPKENPPPKSTAGESRTFGNIIKSPFTLAYKGVQHIQKNTDSVDAALEFAKNLTVDAATQAWEQVTSLFSDFKELFLFAVTLGLLVLILVLFYYSSITKEVKQESRCLRQKRNKQVGGIYNVQAHNEFNDPLYQVSYDLAAKKYNISCMCTPGDIVNRFTDIKVYDQRNPLQPITKVDDHVCQCDRNVEPVTTYYDGYPELIRFMNNDDITLFTNSSSYL